jgi:hypothetical protein
VPAVGSVVFVQDANGTWGSWCSSCVVKMKEMNERLSNFLLGIAVHYYHPENILNFFFDHRSTNPYADTFNSNIKGFRANLRGVTDVPFFLFRFEKLFA